MAAGTAACTAAGTAEKAATTRPGSTDSYTSMCRSHDVTTFSAPTGADGAGEPALGIPAVAGRVAHTGPPRQRLDDPADPPAPPDPTGAAPAYRHQLAAVPAHPGH